MDGLLITASVLVEASMVVDDDGADRLWHGLIAGPRRRALTVAAAGYRCRPWHPSVEVEVRRSARRRRTVSAYRDGDRIVVMIPGRFTRAEEAEWVAKMVARLDTGDGAPPSGAAPPTPRCAPRRRAVRALPRRPRRPASVRWVPTMRTRWASCTPADGTIRLSERLRRCRPGSRTTCSCTSWPTCIVPGHGPEFWALVDRYPRTERARGYLDGVSAAAHLPIADDLRRRRRPTTSPRRPTPRATV